MANNRRQQLGNLGTSTLRLTNAVKKQASLLPSAFGGLGANSNDEKGKTINDDESKNENPGMMMMMGGTRQMSSKMNRMASIGSRSTSSNKKKNVSLAEQRSDLASGLTSVRGSEKVYNEEAVEEDYWAEIDVKKLRIRELRAALEARGLSCTGGKRQLQARLQQSVHEEKEEELEYLAMVEAARRAEAALEESGSVYTTGLNRKGQLGHGDREDRFEFTVVKELRGKGVVQVAAGGDIAVALSENGNVFTWGGIGTGKAKPKKEKKSKNGRDRRRKRRNKNEEQLEDADMIGESPLLMAGEDGLANPRLLETLQGEGVIQVSTGPNHSIAVTDSGDVFSWGDGSRGQLGNGKFDIEVVPCLLETFEEGTVVTQVSAGQTHTLLLIEEDTQAFASGFSNSGKLGIGITERKGVQGAQTKYFPTPMIIPALEQIHVRLIACSANHSAVITDSGVFTWGSGDGGRLGHNDHKDRLEPTLVEALKGQIVIDLSLGFWSSAVIVQVPPIMQGGQLMTFGSGYHGQLAMGDEACCLIPTVSQVCVDMRLLFVKISCGPTHSVAQTVDGDLYSWGSNGHGELGRELEYQEDIERQYTPIPGFIPGFNTIIDRVGRGNVLSFACGKEFTIVATSKYVGESEEEMLLREQEERRRIAEQEADEEYYRKLEERKAAKKLEIPQDLQVSNVIGCGCELCDTCPGFDPNIFRPNECKECGHKQKRHTKPKRTHDF